MINGDRVTPAMVYGYPTSETGCGMNSNPGQLPTYKPLLPVLINQTTYIFYNRIRRHSYLGYVSPVDFGKLPMAA